MDGQINDGSGNLFHPNKPQRYLSKLGWRVVKRRKAGMIWMVRWQDGESGETYSQGEAVRIQRDRDRLERRS